MQHCTCYAAWDVCYALGHMQQDTHVVQQDTCYAADTRYTAGHTLCSRTISLGLRVAQVLYCAAGHRSVAQRDTVLCSRMQCYTRTQAAQAGTAEHFGP